ncbi:MAG: TraR/DksA family transcriptional regulator [Bacteroidetes bacterium]|nr:TraR/DksA family transcriptional regulator [Bacteroidota bacterium]
MEQKEKSYYTDEELQEFKELILKKLESAKAELKDLAESGNNSNGTDDTGSVYKTMEDGNSTLLKENISQLASRQRKFIDNLEMALLRIENKTYGICKVTGKLIPKERLLAVPHTTQSMEAKLKQYK